MFLTARGMPLPYRLLERVQSSSRLQCSFHLACVHGPLLDVLLHITGNVALSAAGGLQQTALKHLAILSLTPHVSWIAGSV